MGVVPLRSTGKLTQTGEISFKYSNFVLFLKIYIEICINVLPIASVYYVVLNIEIPFNIT